MNYRLKGIKVPALLLTLGIIAVLGISMQSCSGGGSGGGSTGQVQLTGTVQVQGASNQTQQ